MVSLRLNKYWIMVLGLAVMLTAAGSRLVTAEASDQCPDMYSSQMILINLDKEQVVEESGSKEIIYPASLTKMMTAVVALEKLKGSSLDDMIVMPEGVIEELREENASMAGFEEGEVLTARDLLYGMMLPSGADGAVGLAVYLCGSETAFVNEMNMKAAKLGMSHTHFENVTGLHSDNHYSTLEDLSTLLEYALKIPDFRKIFTTSTYETSKTGQHPEGIVLESTLFGKMSVAALEDLALLGGKTGFTNEAGLCLATLASCGGEEYILITAGARARTSANAFHIIDAVKVYSQLSES